LRHLLFGDEGVLTAMRCCTVRLTASMAWNARVREWGAQDIADRSPGVWDSLRGLGDRKWGDIPDFDRGECEACLLDRREIEGR